MFTPNDDSIICWRGTSVPRFPDTSYSVYLLHFKTPLGNRAVPRGQARHYLGACRDLDVRLFLHAHGNGSAIMTAVGKAGISWELCRLWRVSTWEESRDLEHALKRRHDSPALCPCCNPRLDPDPLVGLRLGHWPISLHSTQARPRRPLGRW